MILELAVVGWIPSGGLSVWSLRGFSPVLRLPATLQRRVGLTGDSKLSVTVSVVKTGDSSRVNPAFTAECRMSAGRKWMDGLADV